MTRSGNKTAGNRRVRLQKFLADAGVASRRKAEELIEAGRVLVNDELVTELPAFVDPQRDRVTVDGTRVRLGKREYFLVHKPKGVVCTNRDPAGRLRAVDLLPPLRSRLNVVGRLDVDSTGLLLMTNDGELAEQVTHPRYGIPKVYRVEVRGQVTEDVAKQLLKGVHLAEGKAAASRVELVHRSRQASVLMVTLREGRNRQVRRMLAKLGYKVRSLKRVQIGPLSLKGLPVGACRRLTASELRALRHAVEQAARMAAQQRAKPPVDQDRVASARRSRKRKTMQPSRPKSPPTSPGGDRPKRRLIT